MPVSAGPVVAISTGAVSGIEIGDVQAFLGVPYAAPPVGARRFLPPEAAEPWTGVRAAVEHGPAAPQSAPTAGRTVADLSVDLTDEDCLTLSVWTPDPSPSADLPVMVWIHGGAFVAGGNRVPSYDGHRLAARGVVVVSINYRLGLLGWLRCAPLGATGNQGLADQLAALHWVQDEIRAFGGDPGNVTAFGASAGAGSIAALLSVPGQLPARRAILQSGSLHRCRTPTEADEVCARAAASVGGDLQSLNTLPVPEILGAQDNAAPRSAGVLFGPVTDGGLVATDPGAAISDGSAAGVDVLIGTNANEMGFFWGRDESHDTIDDAQLAALAGRVTDRPGHMIAAYRQARADRDDPVDNRSVACALVSDATYRVPAMELAGRQASHANTWAYLFDRTSPRFDGVVGAAHTLEVPFIMGTYAHPTVADFVGADPDPMLLSEEMMNVWVRFATSGECGWPTYNTTRRTTRRFGSDHIEDDPLGPELAAWG